MTNLQLQLQVLHKKVLAVTKQLQQLQKDNSQLQAELVQTQNQLKQKTAELNAANQKLDAVKLRKMVFDDHEKQILAKRIDGYLKEIDNCLAQLNA
ncbi:MAG: hypothetical protein ACOVQE_09990 [Chitinophagaceae bacterium]